MNDRPGLTSALSEAAALLSGLPDDIPQPYVTAGSWGYADVNWQLMINTSDQAEQKALAARIIREVGGKWDKDPGTTFRFTRSLGGLRLRVSVDREAVCERIVTGTKSVTIPAVEAQPEHTQTVEVVEWRCEPLLAQVTA